MPAHPHRRVTYLTSPQPPVLRMCQTMFIRPRHVPLLVIASLLLIASSDGRMPRQRRPIAEKLKILHASKDPPKNVRATVPLEMLMFSKRIYSETVGKNVTDVVNEFQIDFDHLNKQTEGNFGQALGYMFEIRLSDLMQSVRHAKAMLGVVDELAQHGAPG